MLDRVDVPSDLNAALETLAGCRAGAILSGGTLLMPEINTRATGLTTLVSLKKLDLAGISVSGTRVTIGATTTLDAFGRDERLALLKPVVESIASPPVRNMASVAGNLFAAQPYGDLAVALLALDAEVEIAGPKGKRQAPVSEIVKKGVAADEIVTALTFDLPDGGSWFYAKTMRRNTNSAAIVCVAARVQVEGGVVKSASIALGGAGPRPLRVPSVEAALVGKPLDAESVTAAAAKFEADCEPFTDAYASAWYRTRVIPVHIRRALVGA
ncbi:FAD binding domain-containing protein [Jiella avicenniae]|uniref:FAD binding domain-containing protein n=1 Tax=Jiella avicenniae TaxID=2907202 RepID=A0A9X1P3L2_9HYPH|nr:FAD binding domain-containing protein [Jiella avicenniae]MCE7029671.1 FAD binding domain-containing protein [Jiella avicenniae]